MKESSYFLQVWKKGDKRKRIVLCVFLLAVLAASLFRIILAWRAPYVFQTASDHDDALQVTQAASLISHNWLGAYNQLTLSKGISFPLFLMILYRLHLPYGIGLGTLMVVTSACMMASLRPVLPNPWLRTCGYLLLLYNPLGFSSHLALRIYRSSVTPWACLLVISAFAGIFLRRREPVRHLIFWSLLGTAALPFFWYLREDSIWLAPFIILDACITFLLWVVRIKKRGISLLLCTLLLLLPFGGLFGFQKVQEAQNLKCYGIATDNDRSRTNYATVMGLLHHIDDGTGRMETQREQDQEWVSLEAMQQAVAACPSLQKLGDILWDYWDAWAGDNGRIEGDIASWMLRDAVCAAGYYTDGAAVNTYYGQLAEELRQAFRDGELKERKAVYFSSQAKGFVKKDFLECIPLTFQTFGEDAVWTYCEESASVSQGTPEQILLWENVMRTASVLSDDVLGEFREDPTQEAYVEQRIQLNQQLAAQQKRVVSFANAVTAVWKALSIPLLVLAAAGYVLSILRMIRDRKRDPEKQWFSLWLVMTGILLSAFLDIYMVCLFSRWLVGAFTGIFSYYGNVAYTLIMVLELIGIGCLFRAASEKRAAAGRRQEESSETH